VSDLQDIIATSTIRAYNQGARDERYRIISAIEEQVKKQEEAASTIDATGILIGLKKAELYVKELKWT
jgi:hypothetical protein